MTLYFVFLKVVFFCTRLNGLRRYYYMEVIGRVEPGAETENESGDRVDGSTYAVATGM